MTLVWSATNFSAKIFTQICADFGYIDINSADLGHILFIIMPRAIGQCQMPKGALTRETVVASFFRYGVLFVLGVCIRRSSRFFPPPRGIISFVTGFCTRQWAMLDQFTIRSFGLGQFIFDEYPCEHCSNYSQSHENQYCYSHI